MSKWLLLDCNYLCHRAKHSMGGLKHGNTPTGIIYGFLKTISALQEQFDTRHVVFCWDSKTSLREEIFPAYKETRRDKYKDMTKKEKKFEKEFRYQMKMLRKKYLRKIGYRNVFCKKGFEGDDLIASVCNTVPVLDEVLIISSDHDLYQCISSQVSCYDPSKGKRLTLQGFKKKYGIHPKNWASVKAWAGCSTDGVPGVKGVGEKTAIKYVLGQLKESSKACKAIMAEKGMELYFRNMRLVKLPFERTKRFKLKEDELTLKGWRSVTKLLGMKSLQDKPPIGVRRKGKRK